MIRLHARRNRLAILAAAMSVFAGCGHRTWHYVTIPNASVSLPPLVARTPEDRRAGQPPEPLEIRLGGDQIVLVASLTHDNPRRDLDEWGRAFVVVVDGGLAIGRLEVTPENGRFIAYERFRPARRPYVGLDGYMNILAVSSSKVTAYCALRSRSQYTNEKTMVLRGIREFRMFTSVEPFLHSGGIQLGSAAAGAEAEPVP